ncbi:MAG TPA: hypothetical protein VFR91_00510 [Dyella sp.]|nr:hypothetical protein [Dyella sp.]
MKKVLLGSVLVVAMTALLGGCYVAPGYSYVRGPDGGGAYYGRATTVYDDGYYAPYGYGYYDYPYAYPGGVTVGVGTTWYGGSRYRRYDRDDHRWHGEDHRGHWDRDGDRDHGQDRYREPPRHDGGHDDRQPRRRDDADDGHRSWRGRDDRRR